MTRFEQEYLIINLYYDFGRKAYDNANLTKLGTNYNNGNNIVELINLLEMLETVEKYSLEYSNMNNLTNEEMNEILTGINILNDTNYNLTF